MNPLSLMVSVLAVQVVLVVGWLHIRLIKTIYHDLNPSEWVYDSPEDYAQRLES